MLGKHLHNKQKIPNCSCCVLPRGPGTNLWVSRMIHVGVCIHLSPSLPLPNICKTGEPTPTKIDLHAFHIPLYLYEFFEPILFFDPMAYGLKGSFGFEGKGKGSKSPQLEKPRPPKMVCMHFRSTSTKSIYILASTCMNFLS